MFAKVFIGGPVEFDELDGAMMCGRRGFHGGNTDGCDFFADAITGNDGDADVGTARTERSGGHGRKVTQERSKVERCKG
jgi:hypothetical protein